MLKLEWHEETEHEVETSERETFKCQICTYVGQSHGDLELHTVGTHTFPCQLCKEVFTNVSRLNDHRKTHFKENEEPTPQQAPERCDQCEFESKSVKEFVTHLLEKHRNNLMSYKCSFCDYATTEPKALDEHMVKSHDMIAVMYGLAENQLNVQNSFDKFKEEVANAFKRINEDHNLIKQELFMLRQLNHDQLLQQTQFEAEPSVNQHVPLPGVPEPRPSPPDKSGSSPDQPSSPPQVPLHASPAPTMESKAEKILIVWDSISGKLHKRTIEIATKAQIKTVKVIFPK